MRQFLLNLYTINTLCSLIYSNFSAKNISSTQTYIYELCTLLYLRINLNDLGTKDLLYSKSTKIDLFEENTSTIITLEVVFKVLKKGTQISHK